MKSSVIAAALFAVFAAAPAHAGDADKGAKVFNKCKACHMVGDGAKNRVGPQLNAVVAFDPRWADVVPPRSTRRVRAATTSATLARALSTITGRSEPFCQPRRAAWSAWTASARCSRAAWRFVRTRRRGSCE